jgi:hypothetical protein
LSADPVAGASGWEAPAAALLAVAALLLHVDHHFRDAGGLREFLAAIGGYCTARPHLAVDAAALALAAFAWRRRRGELPPRGRVGAGAAPAR